MPVAEECFNRWPETAFHNWVDLRQSLAFKLWRDASPVFLRLRQAPCDLRLARVEALAFQSWRVAAVLSHCITEKRRQSHPVDSRSKISGGSLREHEMAAGDLAVFVVSRGGSHRGDRVASNAATIAFEAYQLVA